MLSWFVAGLLRAPVRTAIVLSIAVYVVKLVAVIAASLVIPPVASSMWRVADGAAAAALVLVLIRRLGWSWQTGPSRPLRAGPALWALTMLPVACTLALGLGTSTRTSVSLGNWIAIFTSAFNEELLNSGLIVAALLPRGPRYAVAVSALITGGSHVTNAISYPLDAVLAQVASNVGSGALYSAIRLQVGSIWLVVLGHWLINLASAYFGLTLGQPGIGTPYLVIGAISMAAALLLMRSRSFDAVSEAAQPVPAG